MSHFCSILSKFGYSLTDFHRSPQYKNFTEIHAVGATLIHMDVKITGTFRYYEFVPENVLHSKSPEFHIHVHKTVVPPTHTQLYYTEI